MATPAQRIIQDQNLNFLYNGTTPGGKTDVSKADKRGGVLGGRKALNDISNSRKPSAFTSVKKDSSINVICIDKDPSAVKGKSSKTSEKGKVISIDKDPSAVKGKSSKTSEKGKIGGRKALTDLTNSVKPRPKQAPSLGRKLNSVAEEAGEGFLHNHQECIKAQFMTADKDYFLKSVGLSNDTAGLPSARKALPLTSKKVESYVKNTKMEELVENVEARGCCSPTCRSPQSPYMSCWEDEEFSELMMAETPKLK